MNKNNKSKNKKIQNYPPNNDLLLETHGTLNHMGDAPPPDMPYRQNNPMTGPMSGMPLFDTSVYDTAVLDLPRSEMEMRFRQREQFLPSMSESAAEAQEWHREREATRESMPEPILPFLPPPPVADSL